MDIKQRVKIGGLQIKLQQATFIRQNQEIFSQFSWQIKPGEHWTIYGPVGAGKTTLLAALSGQLPLKSGSFKLHVPTALQDGWQEIDRSLFRQHTAMVSFQQQAFFNYGRAFYQQRYQSLESEIAIPTVREILQQAALDSSIADLENIADQLQLRELLPLSLIKLSNGQTRKLQIARALLQKPKLLILDNPFIGLDEAARSHLKELINKLIKQGTQILLATNQPEIPELINRVLWLQNFRVQGVFTREQFLSVISEKSAVNDLAANQNSSFIKPGVKPEVNYPIAVRLENVNVRYQNKLILNNLNWTVKQGEKWALIGPNGSGKSTLLSLIYADNPQAFANKIWLFGRRKGSGESIWEIKKRIGFVSPELHVYFRQPLTGAQVAATGFTDTLTRAKQLSEPQSQLIQNHFAFFERLDLLTKPFLQLSAGEQRLILLIRSLIKNPELIIWDEPFQGLSPDYIHKATNLLQRYCTASTTLILVTHYAHEVPDFVTNFLHLEAGQVKSLRSI